MLKLVDALGTGATSPVWISHHDEPSIVLAVGNFGGAGAGSGTGDGTLTLEINPDPTRETWYTLAQGGNNLTLSSTNVLRVLQIPGVYVRLKANNNATGMDLNVWVSGKGVSLVSAEPT